MARDHWSMMTTEERRELLIERVREHNWEYDELEESDPEAFAAGAAMMQEINTLSGYVPGGRALINATIREMLACEEA